MWDQVQKSPCITYFIGEEDKKIIASFILTITPSFIRGGDGYGFLEHVVIHRDYRRNGYGKAIVNHALNFAWDKKCTEVMLLSGSANERAHKMYKKIGFDILRKKGFIIYSSRDQK
ncbi:GNAT family N-acetyltransferase [Candidatus Lokiarchaeum ossiferum]